MQQTELTSRIFHIYRLSLSGVILAVYLLLGEDFFGKINTPAFFLSTSITWFVVAAITSFSSFLSRQLDWLTCTSFLLDVAALSILGWASDGLSGGIFFLMLPSAAMAGLMLPVRLALLVASIATLGTFAAQTALIFDFRLPASAYFPSGVLGSLIFLSTVVFSALAKRISASEREALKNLKVADRYQKINEAIIERMQTGVVVVDDQLKIHMANLAAQRMLNAGLSRKSIIGEHLNYLPNLFNAYKNWLSKPSTPVQAFTHSYSGASLLPGFSQLAQGENLQTLIWLEDTRTIRQRAQQFKFQSLSKISSGLAHEVRNPLSAVQQANDLLLQSPDLSESDKQLTEVIERHCNRMNDIINVVQQLSRRVESSPAIINVKTWLPAFIQEFQETQKDIGNIAIEPMPDCQIYFDSGHLKQILTNLLENGIRHGVAQNSLASQTICVQQSKEGRFVYLDITDEGPGISEEDQQKIFDPFYTTATGGSGLGLYLVRELCEANYASVNYLYGGKSQDSGYFRITSLINPPRN